MVQPASSPGTAKEPRPASHFRLVLQGVEGAGLVKGSIRKDSITLREIAPRQVMTYKAGRKLAREFPPLKARIADTFTRAQSDQRFLLRTEIGGLLAGLLGKVEADATYAKKSNTVAGTGSVHTGQVAGTASEQTVLVIPGFGEIRATMGSTNTSFSFVTTSTDPIQVSSSDQSGGGSSVSGDPFDVTVNSGRAVTLQLVKPGAVATVTISAAGGASRLLSAQAVVGP